MDFTEFKDELTLDADTTVNGNRSLVIRTGLGSIQNSTSGSNDLQLSAEDKLILAGASFDLSTSNGAVDIISNQRLDLSAGGTLTIDTSANNSNILLKTGSGNINVSTGTLTMTGVLDVRDSTGTLGLVVDSTGNVGVGTTAPAALLDIKPSAGATDGLGLRLQNGGGGVTWELKAGSPAVNNDYFTIKDITNSAVRLTITNSGYVGIGNSDPLFRLDTAGGIIGSNSGVLLRAGQSALDLSSSATSTTADIQLAAADRIDLFAGSLSLQTSSTSAVDLMIFSIVSLILDTSSSVVG